MKKICFSLLILLILGGGAFGAGAKEGSRHIEVGFDLPIVNEFVSGTSTNMIGVGFGVTVQQFFTENWGMFSSIDINFPQKITLKANGQKASIGSDIYDSIFALNIMMGPSYMPFKNEKMFVSIMPGIHYTMLSSSVATTISGVKYSTSTTMWGVGLGVGADFGYKFTDMIYLKVGLDLAYDFFQYSMTAVPGKFEGKTSNAVDLFFTPKIGIGFNF